MIDLLLRANELLAAIVLIVAFSLAAYIALHNWRYDSARALCVLLGTVVVVYGGDVLIARAVRLETVQFLLRAQWLGVALAPAAYLHLAHALATYNQFDNKMRRWMVSAAYASSVIYFVLALTTDLIVTGGITVSALTRFDAGPLLWLYLPYLFGSLVWLGYTITRLWQQALTPALRRRMSYLLLTFPAPGLSIFPYLTLTNSNDTPPTLVVLTGSLVVAALLVIAMVVLAYSLAFQSAYQPERLIKYDFSRWWLYGPSVGVTIILCLQTVPWLERRLGLPADTLITFAVMIMTVVMPIVISRARPFLDAVIYRRDRAEFDYLRSLPRQTFTHADLRQLLENTLVAVCGALRVQHGFVLANTNDTPAIVAMCGQRQPLQQMLEQSPPPTLLRAAREHPAHNGTAHHFVVHNGLWLLPLHSPDGEQLGVMGVPAPANADDPERALSPDVYHLIDVMAHQVELALTTVGMQQRLFDVLRGMRPDMESLQQLNTRLEQATTTSLTTLEVPELTQHPEFAQMVKDALSHYWGGPKLTDSPLLALQSVRTAVREQGGSPTKALQSVLREAISNMRPDDQLDPSAQEWLLYNILDMRFLQGKRIRDVSNHLAMSESDYYRKQRVAIEQVARQLALIEDGVVARQQLETTPS